ncbi:MFS general substrate transporter [Lactarius akahatsu]|uniref:MFS general substrate transporter n=1 Tax=Lactarius akahatsu TaxID=416441 RepID=A0AAD4LBY6_9AGAM|nr:MFS general substrate transporter [Lactarius akahatsu]
MSQFPPRFEDDHLDEETPFLPKDDAERKPTPLPRLQIAILLSIWLVDSVISHSISPYLNQLVKELPIVGDDERKVGYYTGIIVSAHFAAEAVTVLHWNRLSDHIGRKPVLLLSLAGSIVSVIVFGLSRSFWALVLSRALHGALKGYGGVVKSMVAELTDETNVARGFSMLPMTWSLGYVIGPFIGGMLSRPQDRWPRIFSHPFWAEYSHFLPCLVAAAHGCASLTVNVIYLNETVNCHPFTGLRPSEISSDVAGEEPAGISHALLLKGLEKPPPLRSILTRPVLISISSYAMLSLLSMAAVALIPHGSSRTDPTGLVDVDRVSVSMCALVYALFPFENLALRHFSSSLAERLLITLQLLSLCITETGYSTIYVYISSAVPNKRSLGGTNGLA